MLVIFDESNNEVSNMLTFLSIPSVFDEQTGDTRMKIDLNLTGVTLSH
jgi:hypothetical protein